MNSTSIYLDTHVIIWLYVDERDKLSNFAQSIISQDYNLICSPLVKLELQYLYEIGRITDSPDVILLDLAERVSLRLCDKSFSTIINRALSITWTRDVFDRLIVANAMVNENILLSKDHKILENYTHARW
jgi:PIN domain nuclease of toxin-antitoxin system